MIESTSCGYRIPMDAQRSLREQLRLLAFDEQAEHSEEALDRVRGQLGTRGALTALLEGGLDFHGEDTGYASHDLHAFAAKFPPQLPRAFIRGLTNVGDLVLDPMMGSGTAIVEAILAGRKALGFDIDPLALRLGRVKTMSVDIDTLQRSGQRVLSRAHHLLEEPDVLEAVLARRFDAKTRRFVDYWFAPRTQRELAALIMAIEEVPQPLARSFLELTFSGIIITKSGGVSLARDLAHSRPHLDVTKVPRNAIDQFAVRLRKNLASMCGQVTDGALAAALPADARAMPVDDGSVDLIVTSPPYANAIDYMRAHKFSLVWFGRSSGELSRLRSHYLGSERVGNRWDTDGSHTTHAVVQKLAHVDPRKASILRKYYAEMQLVLREMYRVLRDYRAAVLVVGPSIMRGIDTQTHTCLAELASSAGFQVVGIAKRALDRNKRMMPARFSRDPSSVIEQRMHEEYVLGLFKP